MPGEFFIQSCYDRFGKHMSNIHCFTSIYIISVMKTALQILPHSWCCTTKVPTKTTHFVLSKLNTVLGYFIRSPHLIPISKGKRKCSTTQLHAGLLNLFLTLAVVQYDFFTLRKNPFMQSSEFTCDYTQSRLLDI